MSYSKFSTSVAEYISKEIKLDEEKQLVVAYAIENIVLSIAGFILIILVGALFGAALPAGITALSGGFLRRLSGGAHAQTPLKCLIYSSLGYGLAAAAAFHMSKLIIVSDAYLVMALVFSLLIAAFYAPVDCPAKRIKSPVLRKRLKVGSVCFILLIMALIMIIDVAPIELFLTFGVFLQSLTLFPAFNKH